MVKNKVILLCTTSVLLLLASCATPKYSWEKYSMDGHRTGVTNPGSDNVTEALGTWNDGVYTAPNGKVFTDGATPEAAKAMIDAQDTMRFIKEVIGYAPREMKRNGPDAVLRYWTVDLIMSSCEKNLGIRPDVGIMNGGGIRCDFPAGDIILDDVKSMFPFDNNICVVYLKGSDLLKVFEQFAQTRPQCIGGVKFVARQGVIEQLLIQGEELDPDKTYVLVTLDFLLDGGDHLYLARNAQKVIRTDMKMMYVVEAYVRDLTAKGLPVEYHTDDRVVFEPIKRK